MAIIAISFLSCKVLFFRLIETTLIMGSRMQNNVFGFLLPFVKAL